MASRQKKEHKEHKTHASLITAQTMDMTHLHEPGFEYCWMNNEGGNIQQRLHQGWEVVEAKDGVNRQNIWTGTKTQSQKSDIVRMPVGRGSTTDAMEAIYMRIPVEVKRANKQPEYDRIALKKKALKNGAGTDGLSDEGVQTYAPNLPDGSKGYSEKLKETL